MNTKTRFMVKIASVLVLTLVSVMASFAQVPEVVKASNWEGTSIVAGKRKAVPDYIAQSSNSLKLMGSYVSTESIYGLKAALSKQFENKLVDYKLTFNGDFTSGEASFIALVQRGSSVGSIFWQQQCYALLLKGDKIEVQKHGKGNNPNLTFRYADFPALGFKTFPIGQEVTVSYGIIQEDRFPRMIVKINGVEMVSVLDNKYGQTVRPNPNNRLLVGMISTNREDRNDLSPKSHILIHSITAK